MFITNITFMSQKSYVISPSQTSHVASVGSNLNITLMSRIHFIALVLQSQGPVSQRICKLMIETLLSFVYSLVMTITIQACHKFGTCHGSCRNVMVCWNPYTIFVLSQSFMFYFSYELRNPLYNGSLGTLDLCIAIDGIPLKL